MPVGHKPPGVNVVEKHGLPNEVVAAATTGLTLVGRTVKTGRHHAGNLLKMPVRPTSMAEFQRIFGGAHRRLFHQNADDSVTPVKQHNFLLYLARHFSFGNAGYQCCAVAFGARIDPETNLPEKDFQDFLDAVDGWAFVCPSSGNWRRSSAPCAGS